MHMQTIRAVEVQVGKTPNAQDTVYHLDILAFEMVVEFRQDPVDPSTFRRYINGVRR